MRLFPTRSPESDHRHVSDIEKSSLKSIDIISGLVCLVPGYKRAAVLKKCFTYGTAVVVPFALHNRYVEQRIAAHSLRSENGDVPNTVYVGRLSHSDIDNAVLLGGLVSSCNLSGRLALAFVHDAPTVTTA